LTVWHILAVSMACSILSTLVPVRYAGLALYLLLLALLLLMRVGFVIVVVK
jgi:hypothetical protein